MANVINGTNQDDTIFGTDEADTINGLAGNDTIYASFGTDFEDGGDGIDTFVINAPLGLPYEVVIDLSFGKAYEFGQSPDEALASVINFENVTVESPSNFVLIGDHGANELIGGSGNDYIEGGAGDDDIEGGAGDDDLTGGPGADRFVFNGPVSESLGNDIIKDFNISEGDRLSGVDDDGIPHTLEELNIRISSNENGDGVLETTLGTLTVLGLTAQELADYVGAERNLTESQIAELLVETDYAPDPSADTFNVQRGIVGKGSGYDTYIFSKWLIDADAEITITDSGDNALQFINGFEVSSSMVAANAMLLTLSNGAVVTVLDASSYDYTVGGNPLENEAGLSFTYQTFVEDVLGVDMPVGSQISQGGAVTINSSMSFGNDVVVIEGLTAFGTDAVDEFQIDVSNGGSFAINDFDVEADSLSLSGLSEAIGDVLADINGDTGVGGQAINVQYDPFEQETFINLGIDAEGEVVSLTLSGISEADWSSVALV